VPKPYYEIKWEPRHRIVHSRQVGFFPLELAEQFCAAIVTLIRELPPGPFDILGDLTEHPVQSCEVHERMVAFSPQ
jgi:hypothetical protein